MPNAHCSAQFVSQFCSDRLCSHLFYQGVLLWTALWNRIRRKKIAEPEARLWIVLCNLCETSYDKTVAHRNVLILVQCSKRLSLTEGSSTFSSQILWIHLLGAFFPKSMLFNVYARIHQNTGCNQTKLAFFVVWMEKKSNRQPFFCVLDYVSSSLYFLDNTDVGCCYMGRHCLFIIRTVWHSERLKRSHLNWKFWALFFITTPRHDHSTAVP